MTKRRYFLDADNDGNWYLIPVERRKEWDAWTELDSDDEGIWDVPTFAEKRNRPVNFLEFENPIETGL